MPVRSRAHRTLLRSLLFLFVSSVVTIPAAHAQSLTTGGITGTVKDQSGAVLPGATVTLKSLEDGSTHTATSSQAGAYQFNLLTPGRYTVEASANGLKTDVSNVSVQVGAAAEVDLVAKVESTREVVEVSTTGVSVDTENANLTTTFSTKQVLDLPAAGGDITTVAFTAPGVVMSTGMGYGNFSSHGLPGVSNLFTMNGDDYNDAYLNLNNSGASNLLLGQNEVSEAAVVQNGYTVQYGREAGAQVNYVTKGGTNQVHFDLLFNFNNDLMNANDFFSNLNGVPRSYAVSKQWGADIGGPIWKNKLFFYSDSEGLYYTLPSTGTVVIPSVAFEQDILARITPAQNALYSKAFSIWNNAPGAANAANVTTGSGQLQDSTGNLGCGDFANTRALNGSGVFGVNLPCARAFGTSSTNTNKEWFESHRVDWNINDKQKIFFRFKGDHGFQPTGTSLLTPAQDEQSIQPQYEGQINHTYVISPTMVNNIIGSVLWYSAIFGPASTSAAQANFPTYFSMPGSGGANGGGFTAMGVNWSAFPQGRDVGQFQLIDDFSLIKGNHSMRFGVNFRKNRVTDFSYESGSIGSYFFNSVTDFAEGVTDNSTNSNYFQKFSPLLDAHIRLYNIGIYAQDEWAVNPNLKVTFGLRLDRTANPLCTDKCFSRLDAPFTSSTFQKGLNIPYNASIESGLSHAYYDTDTIVPNPRLGVVWSPRGANSTVIRAGVGEFADLAPAFLVASVFNNAPFPYSATIHQGQLVDLASNPASAAAAAQAQYNAFKSGFFAGQTYDQLNNSVPGGFSPPNYFSIPSKFKTPNYVEWSFEIQQPIGTKNVLAINYSGNHGYNLLIQNGFPNAFATGFAGLPSVAPDPRFGSVTEISNSGLSNYDGVNVQFRRSFSYGFQGQINYSWSHALDNLSNGGSGLPFSGSSLTTISSPNVAANYGNADYDIRHNMTADFIWDTPWKFGNKWIGNLLSNWTVSGKFFVRSGTPYSLIDSALAGFLSPNINASLLATTTANRLPTSCSPNAVNVPCYSISSFLASTTETGFGNVGRNSIYGPGYVDVDASLYKNFNITERLRLRFGASAYNSLNHPHFGNPDGDVASSGFGLIHGTAIPPTSAYGAFQGSAVSGRVLVVTGRLQF